MWGDYILFITTGYPDYDASFYNFKDCKTVPLEMNFDVDEAVIHDGKLFADRKVVRLEDLQVLRENLKWDDYSTKLPSGTGFTSGKQSMMAASYLWIYSE